jgi:hypothetical protein
MFKTARTLALILAVAVILSLAACTGGKTEPGGSSAIGGDTVNQPENTSPATATVDDTQSQTTTPDSDLSGEASSEETTLPLVSMGEVIHFGEYEWLILDKQDGKALLITKEIIGERAYNGEPHKDVTWGSCSLRQWLNDEFYSSFAEADRLRIVETKLVNEDNQWYDTDGGSDTTDKIWLLSLSELVQYFGDSGKLSGGTQENKHYFSDQYDDTRLAIWNERWTGGGDDGYWWWLRSPGFNNQNIAIVTDYGNIYVGGHYPDDLTGGVRPVMWITIGG